VIEIYVHVETRLDDGSVEQRIYDMDPVTREPCWGDKYTVVNGNREEASVIVRMMNDQFNFDLDSFVDSIEPLILKGTNNVSQQ
jgi:hypothetical protein